MWKEAKNVATFGATIITEKMPKVAKKYLQNHALKLLIKGQCKMWKVAKNVATFRASIIPEKMPKVAKKYLSNHALKLINNGEM